MNEPVYLTMGHGDDRGGRSAGTGRATGVRAETRGRRVLLRERDSETEKERVREGGRRRGREETGVYVRQTSDDA